MSTTTKHYVTHSMQQYRTGFNTANQIAHEVNRRVLDRMNEPTPEALLEELNKQADVALQSIYGLKICSVTRIT